MRFCAIFRIIGLLIIAFSFAMIVPGIIVIIYNDGGGKAIMQTFILTLIIGYFLWLANKDSKYEFKTKECFLIVILFWTTIGSIGSLPFIFLEKPNISITDAIFESFSGLTTTGATTFIGLDHFPKAILFYRQMLQWFGGMGIIVLTVAILPLLGIGGIQLCKAEMPGPLKDNKMRPRIAETAKTLWLIYVLITFMCTISLLIAGMDLFDAVSHSFAIVSNGGFSTHDASIGYFNNPTINIIISFFLIVSGCNFNLHFSLLTGRNLSVYWRDIEFRMFLIFQFIFILISTSILFYYSIYESFYQTINQAIFHVTSMISTSGFTSDNFSKWPLFLPLFLICIGFIGGCAGSTGGGLKVIRVLLLLLQGSRELKKLIHPNAVYIIKLGQRVLPEKIIESVWGFFSAYVLIFFLSLFILIATGVDELSAFSAVATSLNNQGPALGDFSDNFITMNPIGKLVLVVTMLFGRLEVFTLLILFTPVFWKK